MKKKLFVFILASLFIAGSAMVQSNTGTAFAAKKVYGAVYRYSIKGEQLIDQGKLDQAEAYYKSNPGDPNSKVGLGNVYSAKFQLGAAQKQFNDVLRKNPKNPGAHNGLGLVYYRMTTTSNVDVRGKMDEYYQKAINEFQTALRYAPNYPEAHNNLGKVYQDQGKLDQAQDEYAAALAGDPQDGNALVNMGTILFSKGEIDSAIDKYNQAIRLNSKNSTAHYRLGEALVAQGKYGDAIKELQTSLYQYPNSAPVHDKLGEAYELQGNEAAGINEYRKAISIKPEYTNSYLKLANIFENRGDDEFAIAELRSAINVNPDFSEGKIMIADISTSIGKEDQAIKMYQDVLSSDPNNVEALKGIANAYFYKAKKDTLGGMMASPGDYVNAQQALQRAVAAQPNDLELHLALLRVSALAGNAPMAQNELNLMASRIPQTPTDSVIKGEALYSLGRYTDANAEFQRALNGANNVKDVLLMSDIFTVNGNLKLATAGYTKALSLDPNNAKASKGIDRVKSLQDQARTQYRNGQGFFQEGQGIAAIGGLRQAEAMDSSDAMTRWLLAESYRKEDFLQNALDEYQAYMQLNDGTDQKTIQKTQKSIDKLTKQINKMKQKNQPIKDYTQWVSVNRKKF